MTKITEQRLSELNCSTITDREIRKLVKAYRKAKYGDGWIEWGGGSPKPHLGYHTHVEVRFRNGDTDENQTVLFWWGSSSCTNNWLHDGSAQDIIAYRVVRK